MPIAIEIEHLSKCYPKRNSTPVKAVDDLNLTVAAGEVLGFLGANGAGKTTTIKMICGLITPDAGQVRVNSYAVAHERSAAMRQIGAVLEGTRNVYWPGRICSTLADSRAVAAKSFKRVQKSYCVN
jgi:ABC-2 type transport system ATP-binding protein